MLDQISTIRITFIKWEFMTVHILINTNLIPTGFVTCLNILCRKILYVLINCTSEEVTPQIRSISAVVVAKKNVFDSIVLTLQL